jgi:hypothetical protein
MESEVVPSGVGEVRLDVIDQHGHDRVGNGDGAGVFGHGYGLGVGLRAVLVHDHPVDAGFLP